MNENTKSLTEISKQKDFFEYWEALGFFDDLQMTLPPEFFIIFDIARLIATPDTKSISQSAITELLKTDSEITPGPKKNQLFNWQERNVPLSDKMEIEPYKTIYDLKKAIPRELMWGKRIFNIKLFTKTLLVSKHYETETDRFKPISSVKDDKDRNRTKFEQKFYLLLDRSRSMDKQLRLFYSKSIIIEVLRKKLDSKAKLFFRPFDSRPGPLVKIESRDDYTTLIEKVMFTTTGGTSTNMQQAIFQAVDDINFDKDISDAEILVVTDCLVHDLDIPAMKDKLKDIKLNIVKIGLDLAEPNGYEIEKLVKDAGYNFDPFSVNIKDIKKKLESKNKYNSLSRMEQKVYEYMLDCSNKITKDMKLVSEKFIEIDDINPGDFTSLNEDTIESINNSISKLTETDINKITIQELSVLYKKAYFLNQYIEFLMHSESFENNLKLRQLANEIQKIKEKMLSNPYLIKLISGTDDAFNEDRKLIKLSKKSAKKRLREMAHIERNLSRDDIKNAELIFSMGAGSSLGKGKSIIVILLIKLLEQIKSLLKKYHLLNNVQH